MSNIHAVIYTKPHCMPCKMTTKLMDSLGMPYENTYYGNLEETNSIELDSHNEVKRTWSEKKVEKLKAKYNITSLPFIKIIDDETGEELEFWSGFRPEKIKKWNSEIQCAKSVPSSNITSIIKRLLISYECAEKPCFNWHYTYISYYENMLHNFQFVFEQFLDVTLI